MVLYKKLWYYCKLQFTIVFLLRSILPKSTLFQYHFFLNVYNQSTEVLKAGVTWFNLIDWLIIRCTCLCLFACVFCSTTKPPRQFCYFLSCSRIFHYIHPIWEVLWSLISRFFYSHDPVHFIVGDIKLSRAACPHPIFDIYSCAKCLCSISSNDLLYSHKRTETIWYTFIALF